MAEIFDFQEHYDKKHDRDIPDFLVGREIVKVLECNDCSEISLLWDLQVKEYCLACDSENVEFKGYGVDKI